MEKFLKTGTYPSVGKGGFGTQTPPPVESYVPAPEPDKKAAGGIVDEMQQDELSTEVLQMVMSAIQSPDSPQSEEIITGFEEAFGAEALQELMVLANQGWETTDPQVVGETENELYDLTNYGSGSVARPRQAGGIIPGNGDAMADNIITTADAGTPDAQDIAISSGEYVVAGDVVSGLGSGNTSRGAEVLDQLQSDVRMDRTGSPQQPPPIDLADVLPGTYGEEYA